MADRKFPPGLIERKEISRTDEYAVIEETWDPNVPGCPLIVFKTGTWPMERIEGIETVKRRARYPFTGRADLED